MDDDEFEDYVGTEEIIEQNIHQKQGQKPQQVVQQIIVEDIGVHRENDQNELSHRENFFSELKRTQDAIMRVDLNRQQISSGSQSLEKHENHDQNCLQDSQQHRPQQKKDSPNKEPSIQSNIFAFQAIKREIIQKNSDLYLQTVFQKIQQKQVEELWHKSTNQIHKNKIIQHDSLRNDGNLLDGRDVTEHSNLMNEATINYKHTEHNQTTTFDIDGGSTPIQIQNTSHEQNVQLNPQINIETINLQNLLIDPFRQSANSVYISHYESFKLEQKSNQDFQIMQKQTSQIQDILISEHMIPQSDVFIQQNSQINQTENQPIDQNQVQQEAQQEQNDEFGDFETYQQLTKQTTIKQMISEQKIQVSNIIKIQSYSPQFKDHLQNEENEQISQAIQSYQSRSQSQENQLYTRKSIAQLEETKQSQIPSLIPKQREQVERNQKMKATQREKSETVQPQVQIVSKQLTLQDELRIFMNSLPDYKRICQKAFYSTD